MNWLLIGIGGSLGAMSRYAISDFLKNKNNYLPVATLIVNALGSFLLGYLLSYNIINESQGFYFFITGGFLGAFTTFSAFSYEIFDLLKTKQTIKALILMTLNLLIILITGMIGFFFNI